MDSFRSVRSARLVRASTLHFLLVALALMPVQTAAKKAACPQTEAILWEEPVIFRRSIAADTSFGVFANGGVAEFVAALPGFRLYTHYSNMTVNNTITYPQSPFLNQNASGIVPVFERHVWLYAVTGARMLELRSTVVDTTPSEYHTYYVGPTHCVGTRADYSASGYQTLRARVFNSSLGVVGDLPAVTALNGLGMATSGSSSSPTGSRYVLSSRYLTGVFDKQLMAQGSTVAFTRVLEITMHDLEDWGRPAITWRSDVFSSMFQLVQVSIRSAAHLDDKWVAVGYTAPLLPELMSGYIHILDGATRMLVHTLKGGHAEDVLALGLHRPGYLLSVSADAANLWAYQRGCHLRKLGEILPRSSRVTLQSLPDRTMSIMTEQLITITEMVALSSVPGFLLMNDTLLLCPVGYVCPYTNSSIAVPCAANGTYCPSGSFEAASCPAASICPDAATLLPCNMDHYCPPGSTTHSELAMDTFVPSIVGACIAAVLAVALVCGRCSGARHIARDAATGKLKVQGSKSWLLLYETWFLVLPLLSFVTVVWTFATFIKQHCDTAPVSFTATDDASAYEDWFRTYQPCVYHCGETGCERQSDEPQGLLGTIKHGLSMAVFIPAAINQGAKVLLFWIFSMNASCRGRKVMRYVTRNFLTTFCLPCYSVAGASSAFLGGFRNHHLPATAIDTIFQDIPQLALGILYVIASRQPPPWHIAMLIALSSVGVVTFLLDIFHACRLGCKEVKQPVNSSATEKGMETHIASEKQALNLRHRAVHQRMSQLQERVSAQMARLARIKTAPKP